jgi:RND family efflux transporter MFP subunit
MEPKEQRVDLSALKIDRDKKYNDRPRSRKWLWVVIPVVVVVAVVIILNLREAITPSVNVRVTTVGYIQGADATADLVATGYVVARRTAEVASKGTGRLAYIDFDEGDQVAEGDVIARLENDDIVAGLALARANLQAAEVDSLQAGRQYRRQAALLDSGAVTDEAVESAEAAYLAAKASVAAAAAQVKRARVDVENTIIRAPFDGTVLTKNAEVGEIVAPFASSAESKGSVVTLADMSSLEVEADVNESNINRVETGQPCEIILDAYPSVRYKGYVQKIVPTADRARATVLTRVAFSEVDDRVLPEMSARINFYQEEALEMLDTTTLAVSRDAVTSRNGQTVAFVIDEDQRVTMTPIETGRELGSKIEITSGLSDGDRVVLSPPGKLETGQKVSVTR